MGNALLGDQADIGNSRIGYSWEALCVRVQRNPRLNQNSDSVTKKKQPSSLKSSYDLIVRNQTAG